VAVDEAGDPAPGRGIHLLARVLAGSGVVPDGVVADLLAPPVDGTSAETLLWSPEGVEVITKKFTPVLNTAGKPKPWDIEFGFTNGKLWLFQCRPFLGNDDLKNVPALAALDTPPSNRSATLSLAQVIK